jgi:proteasome assembly chaperone (PAC2) family protein
VDAREARLGLLLTVLGVLLTLTGAVLLGRPEGYAIVALPAAALAAVVWRTRRPATADRRTA